MSMEYSINRDDNFVVGDSPVTIAIQFANPARVVVANYGGGNMYGQASVDGGATYGDQMLILAGTVFETNNMAPTHIRFTHIADTAYQLYVEGHY